VLPLIGLFSIVLFSYIVVRVASVALEITGLAEEVADFQAISAFTGTGFTTQETESTLSNPTRRNIIRLVIILGNAGLTTALASLILTFMGNETQTNFLNFVTLIAGLILIIFILSSKHTYYALKKIIYRFLSNYSALQVHDYHEVLGLGKGFVISKIIIDDDSWMVDKELKDLKLDREGTLILSIEKHDDDGKKVFHGAPNGKTVISKQDVLTCYGRPDAIKDLAERESGHMGDKSHAEQCDKLKAVEVLEEQEELNLVND
jgi:hypothetical protein